MHDHQIQLLTEALERGTLAPFIGADLPRALTGIPSRAELACALAQRHDLDESASLARVAQRVGRGGWRRAFTVFLREQVQGVQPQAFHRRVVAFVREHAIKALITTAYDDLLKRAFDAASTPVELVWKDSQLAVAFQDRPLLIQIYGNPLADVESLIVTEDDHLDLWRDRAREDVLDEVKRSLQRNTALFLGYNLSDPDFQLLWREVLSRAGDLHRRAFAVWPGLPETEVGVWADRGIVILEADPWGLLGGAGFSAQKQPSGEVEISSPGQGRKVLPPEAPSISPELYKKVQSTLLRCGPFRSEGALSPLFIVSRLSPWRDGLPGGNSAIERVQATMAYLLPRANAAGENALVLLLRVLRDQLSPGDACYAKLDALAGEIEKVLS